MTLPYDVARCKGLRDDLCDTCRRREPGSPDRQVYIGPQWDKGKCVNYIPQQEDPLEWSRKHGIEEF